MSMPSIKAIARYLTSLKTYLEKGHDMEVRLQVYEDWWAIHTGDPSYDQDHRGWWGCGYLTRQTNCMELAKSLKDEVLEHQAQTRS